MSTEVLVSSDPRMDSLLRYVEKNISVDLDTGTLSGVGYVSAPKLYRDFYNLTGHSVKEYVRKRNEDTKITLTGNPGLRFIVAKAKGYNAEKTASKTVFDYLSANYPHIIETTKELYQRREANAYTCGVRVSEQRLVDSGQNKVELVTTDANRYLVLESSVMGDYDRYADMLYTFARDNGFDADIKELFAVYHAAESFDNLNIKMYCPVKIVIK